MRPRERYACEGPDGLGDVELLALILGPGTAGRPALTIAAELLDRFGGLEGVASAETGSLRRVPGLGLARAVRVHAGLQAGRRSARRTSWSPDRVSGVSDAVACLAPALADLGHEELHALYLARSLRPVARRVLTRGSDGFTVVDPRQVFRPAVSLGATAVILAHNHPSGDPTPSRMDREVTRRVAAAGRVLGVQLVDHLVVGGLDAWSSLAEEGCVSQLDGAWSAAPVGAR